MKKFVIFLLFIGVMCFPQESFDFSNIDKLIDNLEKQLLESAKINQQLHTKIEELQKINNADKKKIEELLNSINNADTSTDNAKTEVKALIDKIAKLEIENAQLKVDKKRLIFLALGLVSLIFGYITLRVLKLLPQSKAFFWWVP